MGHKSGLKQVGAKGKEEPLSLSELEIRSDDGVTVDIASMAREKAEAALKTLTKAARRTGKDKAPWSVAARAARDIIEIGYGRSHTQQPDNQNLGGLQVVINQLNIQAGEKLVTIPANEIAQKVAEAAALDLEPVSSRVVVETAPPDRPQPVVGELPFPE